MAGFYIKRIIARSDSKEDAVVDFTSGLNIIQGRSDTGKSCVLKCMEFVFGGNYDKLKKIHSKNHQGMIQRPLLLAQNNMMM